MPSTDPDHCFQGLNGFAIIVLWRNDAPGPDKLGSGTQRAI